MQSTRRRPARAVDLSPRFHVALAHSPEEVAETQRLRYEVFGVEMGAQVHAPGGLEQDRYDPFCQHLLVRDAGTGAVVSSTRILTRAGARRAGGFYAEGEFDLARLEGLSSQVIEIGRTCVHRDYRAGAAIGTLWAGLARFIEIHQVDHLIGCASVPMRDGGVQATAVMSEVRPRYLSPEAFRVAPLRSLPSVRVDDRVRPVVPPLLKAYLRLGAWVCGEPCWDPDFGVADFFVMLDVDRLETRYVRHFLEREEEAAAARACAIAS